MQISHIMTANVVTVHPGDTLDKVKKIFDQRKFHHLLVVEQNVLVGVISDRDLLKNISPYVGTWQETNRDRITLDKKAHQIMTRDLHLLPPRATVADAVRIFNRYVVSCIPVVNPAGHPMGIVSWRDILKAMEKRHEQKKQSPKND